MQRYLGLNVPAHTISTLFAEAPGPAGRLQWLTHLRVLRLCWLRNAELLDRTDGTRRTGMIDRALDFWEKHYRTERARRTSEPSGQQGDEAAQLAIEHALLVLWRQPEEAARTLHEHFRDTHAAYIREQLGQFAPADSRAPDTVCLLWPWTACPPMARVMLRAMGLGGSMPVERLQRPGRVWLSVAACGGTALGALVVALLALVAPSESPTVAWRKQSVACVQDLAQGTLWRCGARTQRVPVSKDEHRTVAILEPGSPVSAGDGRAGVGAEALALALLDCGEADLVYAGSEDGWTQDRGDLFDTSTAGERTVQIPARERYDRFLALVDRGCSADVQMVDIRGDR